MFVNDVWATLDDRQKRHHEADQPNEARRQHGDDNLRFILPGWCDGRQQRRR